MQAVYAMGFFYGGLPRSRSFDDHGRDLVAHIAHSGGAWLRQIQRHGRLVIEGPCTHDWCSVDESWPRLRLYLPGSLICVDNEDSARTMNCMVLSTYYDQDGQPQQPPRRNLSDGAGDDGDVVLTMSDVIPTLDLAINGGERITSSALEAESGRDVSDMSLVTCSASLTTQRLDTLCDSSAACLALVLLTPREVVTLIGASERGRRFVEDDMLLVNGRSLRLVTCSGCFQSDECGLVVDSKRQLVMVNVNGRHGNARCLLTTVAMKRCDDGHVEMKFPEESDDVCTGTLRLARRDSIVYVVETCQCRLWCTKYDNSAPAAVVQRLLCSVLNDEVSAVKEELQTDESERDLCWPVASDVQLEDMATVWTRKSVAVLLPGEYHDLHCANVCILPALKGMLRHSAMVVHAHHGEGHHGDGSHQTKETVSSIGGNELVFSVGRDRLRMLLVDEQLDRRCIEARQAARRFRASRTGWESSMAYTGGVQLVWDAQTGFLRFHACDPVNGRLYYVCANGMVWIARDWARRMARTSVSRLNGSRSIYKPHVIVPRSHGTWNMLCDYGDVMQLYLGSCRRMVVAKSACLEVALLADRALMYDRRTKQWGVAASAFDCLGGRRKICMLTKKEVNRAALEGKQRSEDGGLLEAVGHFSGCELVDACDAWMTQCQLGDTVEALLPNCGRLIFGKLIDLSVDGKAIVLSRLEYHTVDEFWRAWLRPGEPAMSVGGVTETGMYGRPRPIGCERLAESFRSFVTRVLLPQQMDDVRCVRVESLPPQFLKSFVDQCCTIGTMRDMLVGVAQADGYVLVPGKPVVRDGSIVGVAWANYSRLIVHPDALRPFVTLELGMGSNLMPGIYMQVVRIEAVRACISVFDVEQEFGYTAVASIHAACLIFMKPAFNYRGAANVLLSFINSDGIVCEEPSLGLGEIAIGDELVTTPRILGRLEDGRCSVALCLKRRLNATESHGVTEGEREDPSRVDDAPSGTREDAASCDDDSCGFYVTVLWITEEEISDVVRRGSSHCCVAPPKDYQYNWYGTRLSASGVRIATRLLRCAPVEVIEGYCLNGDDFVQAVSNDDEAGVELCSSFVKNGRDDADSDVSHVIEPSGHVVCAKEGRIRIGEPVLLQCGTRLDGSPAVILGFVRAVFARSPADPVTERCVEIFAGFSFCVSEHVYRMYLRSPADVPFDRHVIMRGVYVRLVEGVQPAFGSGGLVPGSVGVVVIAGPVCQVVVPEFSETVFIPVHELERVVAYPLSDVREDGARVEEALDQAAGCAHVAVSDRFFSMMHLGRELRNRFLQVGDIVVICGDELHSGDVMERIPLEYRTRAGVIREIVGCRLAVEVAGVWVSAFRWEVRCANRDEELIYSAPVTRSSGLVSLLRRDGARRAFTWPIDGACGVGAGIDGMSVTAYRGEHKASGGSRCDRSGGPGDVWVAIDTADPSFFPRGQRLVDNGVLAGAPTSIALRREDREDACVVGRRWASSRVPYTNWPIPGVMQFVHAVSVPNISSGDPPVEGTLALNSTGCFAWGKAEGGALVERVGVASHLRRSRETWLAEMENVWCPVSLMNLTGLVESGARSLAADDTANLVTIASEHAARGSGDATARVGIRVVAHPPSLHDFTGVFTPKVPKDGICVPDYVIERRLYCRATSMQLVGLWVRLRVSRNAKGRLMAPSFGYGRVSYSDYGIVRGSFYRFQVAAMAIVVVDFPSHRRWVGLLSDLEVMHREPRELATLTGCGLRRLVARSSWKTYHKYLYFSLLDVVSPIWQMLDPVENVYRKAIDIGCAIQWLAKSILL